MVASIVPVMALLTYNLSDRRLLRHKRADHIEAAKKIVSINSSAKQLDVVKALFSKLFSVSVKMCLFMSHNICIIVLIAFTCVPHPLLVTVT